MMYHLSSFDFSDVSVFQWGDFIFLGATAGVHDGDGGVDHHH